MSEELEKKVQGVSENGKLPCAKAFQIAKDQGVGVADIGKIANKLNIKITNCQLGCF